MKYIYLNRDEAKKGIALVVAVLEEENKNYKKDYGDNIIEYVGNDIPHYISYEESTDTIREATEEEKVARQQITLEDNQVIIDNIIYTYDKQYQKVIDNKIVDKSLKELFDDKVLTLDEIKAQKREELKRIRAEKIDSDLEVNGNSFQVRERDLQNFYNLKIAVDIDKSKASGKLAWVLADNSIREFSYTELMGVLGAYIARKQEIFTRFGILTMQLEACKTVEEIEAIKWL